MGARTNQDKENVLLLEEKDGNNIEDRGKGCAKSFMATILNFVGELTKEKVTDEDKNKDEDHDSLVESDTNEKDLISTEERESLLEGKRNFKDKLKGTVVAFLVVLKYTASGVSVQLLERRIPDLELNTIRNGGACILYMAVLLLRRRYPFVRRRIFKGLFVYTVVTTICSALIFISMAMIPISVAQSLQQASQIISGILLFALILKERITIRILLSSVLCVAGIMLVIQPDFLFPEADLSSSKRISLLTNTSINTENKQKGIFGYQLDSKLSQVIGFAMASIAGFFVTLDVLVTKYNTSFADYLLEIPFFAFIAGTLLSTIGMLILETPTLPTNWTDVLYIFIHTVSYTMLWPLYIYVLQYISANAYNIIWSTSTVLMLLAQYTILSRILPGHRNWMEVVGVLLVTIGSSLGSLLNIFFE